MQGSKIMKTVKYVITALLYASLITILIVIISMRASGEDAHLFGYQMKAVLSGSMEPDIQTGSIIAIKETELDHPFEKNDVITFVADEGKIITHRIEQVQNDGASYITKGDANDGADIEPVKQANIIGIYKGLTIPYLGYVSTFLNSPKGSALLLILPGIGLIFYSIFMISRVFATIGKTNNQINDHPKK